MPDTTRTDAAPTDTTPPPSAPRARPPSMPGLEFVQAMRDGTHPGAPLGEVLNFRVTEAEPGRVVVEGAPGPAHANTTGQPHGGWYGAILDTAMGCAVQTMVPPGRHYTTLEYRVNITRPIPLGMQVRAEGLVQHSGRSTGIARGEIRGATDGVLYATASTTCLIMPAG